MVWGLDGNMTRMPRSRRLEESYQATRPPMASQQSGLPFYPALISLLLPRSLRHGNFPRSLRRSSAAWRGV